ncbi:hypothetical protein Dsin_024531 [Dipteronia sinensis]|uniref:Uncharacterized protein n=1 Tax=Dipteronia sinensis TaxID=43782 RepID=A0AAD9ZUP7_9ROSI|nr:hypothetical protein Dsin_024531 [Dipteronia sinensis]
MELKVNSSGGIGSSPKRSDYMLRSMRSRNQKTMMSSLMEAIAEMNNSSSSNGGVVSESKEDHGVVRMKIKVRKEDLRQMLQVMKNVNTNNKSISTNHNNTSYSSSSSSSSSSSMSLEQRLNILRRKHHLRGNNINAGGKSGGGSRCSLRSWSPVLQSIPEEL